MKKGEIKTKKTTASATKFIDTVDDEQKRKDSKELLKIYKEITGKPAKMWGTSIIGFDQYHYKSERSAQEGDWPMAAFSPRKANLTLYVMTGFQDFGPLLKKLGPHSVSKACLYIKRLSDVDISVMRKIIAESYEYMKKQYPTSKA